MGGADGGSAATRSSCGGEAAGAGAGEWSHGPGASVFCDVVRLAPPPSLVLMEDGGAGGVGLSSRGGRDGDALGGGRGWLQESSPPRTPASPFAGIPAHRIKVLRGEGAVGSARAGSSPVAGLLHESPCDASASSSGSPDGNSMGQGPRTGARGALQAQSGEGISGNPDGTSSLDPARPADTLYHVHHEYKPTDDGTSALDPARPAQVEQHARVAHASVQGAAFNTAPASCCTGGGTSGGGGGDKADNKSRLTSRSGRTRKRAGRQVPAPRTPLTPTHPLPGARPADENQDPQSWMPSAASPRAGRASLLFPDPAVCGHCTCKSPPPPGAGGEMAPSASPNAANTGGRGCATGSPRAQSLYGSWLHATPERPSPGTAAEKV